jgi:hypothetical protein
MRVINMNITAGTDWIKKKTIIPFFSPNRRRCATEANIPSFHVAAEGGCRQ